MFLRVTISIMQINRLFACVVCDVLLRLLLLEGVGD